MGFSPEIKRKARIASASHCCVCHRRKGLKIEVHHIKQEADGGPNTFENAIPLCFDCHCDAGHYNPKHPKGSKYSPKELLQARDNWYSLVIKNKIKNSENISDDINIKYVICKDLDAAKEIISSDLSNFPIKNTFLLNNEILDYFVQIQKLLKKQYPAFYLNEHCFKDVNEYMKKYPDAIPTNKSDSLNPYYNCIRIPTKDELLNDKKNVSKFIKHVLNIGVDPKEFIQSIAYPEYCGGGDEGGIYCEQTLMRPLWHVFLHVTNVSKSQLSFKEIKGDFCSDYKEYRQLKDESKEVDNYTSKLPSINLNPSESILIPSFICFAPFDNLEEREVVLSQNDTFVEKRQEFSLNQINNGAERFSILGKHLFPKHIQYERKDDLKSSEIHELDLKRVYSIDRHWMCGSCPHLFYQKPNGETLYVKELFALYPAIIHIEKFIVPKNIVNFTIAELEDEETLIESIKINQKTISKNITLNKGETINFNVSEFDCIEILGTYKSDYQKRTIENLVYRNKIIGKYIKETVANNGYS